MSELNFVHLGTGYQLAGFADFESAFKATDKICGMGFRVAYLNEETHICEGEVMVYVLSCTTADAVKYRNYHFNRADQLAATATESIRTALEVLEEMNQFKAKYIAVFYPKTVKEPKLQTKLAC